MENSILHRGGENRYVLQAAETGAFVGLLILPCAGESANSFSYNFGAIYSPKMILNWNEFPELASIEFFTVDYTGDFLRYLSHPEWQLIKTLILAETKYLAFNRSKHQKIPQTFKFLWQYTLPNLNGSWTVPCYEIFVNQQGCYTGNRDGLMLALSHQGIVNYQHQLSQSIRSIVGDKEYVYGSCDEGKVYELSGKVPDEIFNARFPIPNYDYSFQLLKLNLWQDQLLILDVYGRLTLLDAEFKVLWREKYNIWRGLFLASDEKQIYLGHYHGINCYQRNNGQLTWKITTEGAVFSGFLTENGIIIGTSEGKIYQLEKQGYFSTQETKTTLLISIENPIYACVSWENYLFFSDDQAILYTYDFNNNLINKHTLECGAVLDLKIWKNHLYGVTTEGTIFCVEIKQLLGQN